MEFSGPPIYFAWVSSNRPPMTAGRRPPESAFYPKYSPTDFWPTPHRSASILRIGPAGLPDGHSSFFSSGPSHSRSISSGTLYTRRAIFPPKAPNSSRACGRCARRAWPRMFFCGCTAALSWACVAERDAPSQLLSSWIFLGVFVGPRYHEGGGPLEKTKSGWRTTKRADAEDSSRYIMGMPIRCREVPGGTRGGRWRSSVGFFSLAGGGNPRGVSGESATPLARHYTIR